MERILRVIESLFVKRPTQKLEWTPENYVKAKRWALTQPHPFKKGKTLWDFVYDRTEYVRTVENINKYLFNEM